jgi:hypothetical protein
VLRLQPRLIAGGTRAINSRRNEVPHLVLLGDSILDNVAYTSGGPAVIDQVRDALPSGWDCSLLAVDGATTGDIHDQIARLPRTATHLVLSVGGNDALEHIGVLDVRVHTTMGALCLLSEAADEFRPNYVRAIEPCLATGLPLLLCTIYDGSFPDIVYQRAVRIALLAFNDIILGTAIARELRVLDLRLVCDQPEDYANPIEPSSVGGSKIAQAMVRAVQEGKQLGRGAQVAA